MENDQKNPLSPQKLAANRANAQHSTGPRTDEGKARASQNAYRHGLFAKRLFPTSFEKAQDGADYEFILSGLRDDYQPLGFMENFWVERIATEILRLARLVGHEQLLTQFSGSFGSRSVDSILRYQATINRQLNQAIEELERLRARRGAKSKQDPPSGAEVDDPSEELNAEEPQPENGDQLQASSDGSLSGNYGTNPTPTQP